MRKDDIMPDGRPLYAWENEISMLQQEVKRLKEIKDRYEIFKFSTQHWRDFRDGSLHIRISLDSNIAKDFDSNPEKYFEIVKESL